MIKVIHVIFIDDKRDSQEFTPTRVCMAVDGNIREMTLFGYVIPELYKYGHEFVKVFRLIVRDETYIKFVEDAFYSYWGKGFTWKNCLKYISGVNLGVESAAHILRAGGFKVLENKDATVENLMEEVKLYESVYYKVS